MRQQALVPIPVGPTLAVINETLLAQMDARLDTKRDAAGQTIGMRFTEEQRQLRRGSTPFAPEATTFATVSPRALVRLEGAVYSVPTSLGRAGPRRAHRRHDRDHRRARGAADSHPRKRFGAARDRLRHYLSELARKPQAVRQVLPDLLRDLGEPFPAIWDQLHGAHGPREAARHLAKVLGQLERHGAAVVVPALRRRARDRDALRARPHAGALGAAPGARPTRVPASLRDIDVASGCAADYDGAPGRGRMSAAALARELVVAQTRALKLPGIARTFEALARQARDAHWPHEDYLHEVLTAEQASRHESGDSPATPRSALSRGEDPRYVRFHHRGRRERDADPHARAR